MHDNLQRLLSIHNLVDNLITFPQKLNLKFLNQLKAGHHEGHVLHWYHKSI